VAHEQPSPSPNNHEKIRPGSLSERQEAHVPFPFAFHAALGQDEDFFNGLTDRHVLAEFKYPWHWQPGFNPVIRILPHRRHIMCQENATFSGRPFEDMRIILQRQPRILHPHNIQVRRAMKQSPKDAIVEVLVSGQPEHTVTPRHGLDGLTGAPECPVDRSGFPLLDEWHRAGCASPGDRLRSHRDVVSNS
jgi:hypothetical protein